jgi:hypothetical protein
VRRGAPFADDSGAEEIQERADMPRFVHIRGRAVPVVRRRINGYAGLSFKRAQDDRRPVHRRIELHRGLRGLRQLSVLVHEMIHQMDLRFSERTVLALEAAIMELVLENPEVFDGIYER